MKAETPDDSLAPRGCTVELLTITEETALEALDEIRRYRESTALQRSLDPLAARLASKRATRALKMLNAFVRQEAGR
jgi:hypothetical protein